MIRDAVEELIQVAAVAVQAAASLRRQYPPVKVSKPVFCQCVDPYPVRQGDVEKCDYCGGVTKDFGDV